MNVIGKALLVILRVIMCIGCGILFIIGLYMMFTEPGWEAAKYMGGAVYIVVEVFFGGPVLDDKTTPKA